MEVRCGMRLDRIIHLMQLVELLYFLDGSTITHNIEIELDTCMDGPPSSPGPSLDQ